MLARGIVVFAFVILAGCGSETAAPPRVADQADPGSDSVPWSSARIAEGQVVYEQSCASCHDPGASEAPAIGEKEDWDSRSRLWAAVLSEHAKSGYLEMPTKGGSPGLSDQQVNAAVEYMMSVTYPELPAD